VALHHILVVHDSPAVRETVGILLAGEYEVQGMEVDQYLARRVIEPRPRLLVAAPTIAGRPLPEGVAVLWVDDGGGRLPAGPALARQFSPRELRRMVDAALAAAPPPVPAAAAPLPGRLEPPFVPAAVAPVLAEAARSSLPLHLAGEPGIGKRAVTRAVHAARERGQLLTVDADDLAGLLVALPAGTATLCVTRVDALTAAAQQQLLGALGPTGGLTAADGRPVRLITATTADLGAALDAGRRRCSPNAPWRSSATTCGSATSRSSRRCWPAPWRSAVRRPSTPTTWPSTAAGCRRRGPPPRPARSRPPCPPISST